MHLASACRVVGACGVVIVVDVTVKFVHVAPADAREVFQWHRGFAAANNYLFPRSWEQYAQLAEDGRIVCALEDGEYIGLCYYSWDEDELVWELGGLMVATNTRGRSVGSTLMRVTLGHLLFNEEPLSRHEQIISHVHADNDAPRRVIAERLGFAHQGQICVESEKVPGLPADDRGLVWGELYLFVTPGCLEILADWSDDWSGVLRDGTAAEIRLLEGVTTKTWAQAFLDMSVDPLGY